MTRASIPRLPSVLLVVSALVPACQRANKTETPARGPDTTGATSVGQAAASQAAQPTAAGEGANEQDCVHGTPTPILSAGDAAAKPTFEQSGKHEAREHVILTPRTELTVRQFGCAHYAVEYAFMLKGEKPMARSPGGWLSRASELVSELAVAPAQRQVVQSIAATLRKRATSRYAYGDRLQMSEMETLSATVEGLPDGVKLVVLYEVAL